MSMAAEQDHGAGSRSRNSCRRVSGAGSWSRDWWHRVIRTAKQDSEQGSGQDSKRAEGRCFTGYYNQMYKYGAGLWSRLRIQVVRFRSRKWAVIHSIILHIYSILKPEKVGFVSYTDSLYQLVPNFNQLVSERELNDGVFIYTRMCCGNYRKQVS
jgi:hypothetical protein